MQHKVFRIERTATARYAAPAADTVAQRHVAEERSAPAARVEAGGVTGDPSLKRELARAHDLIAQNKRELGALLDDGRERRMARAAGELGAAVEGMEKATQDILKSAECVDDGAKALAAAMKTDYERGLAQDIQDHVVQIYEACNFQDLAGQRIGKVIAMLGTLEHEIAAMLARCDGSEASPPATEKPSPNRGLINGPKLDGDYGHASQSDIDAMFK